MTINTIITSVKKYFTSLSVDSMWGYKKVSLMEADEKKSLTGFEVILDATETINVSITKTVMQHSSESKKVYMDGTKVNPIKMSINAHIEVSKLDSIQKLASDDSWMYVSMSKNIGGSIQTSTNSTGVVKLYEKATEIVGGVKDWFNDVDGETGTQILADSKLYFIQDLTIEEQGFINTVGVTIELVEVVVFGYDVEYKYGVKQVGNSSGTAKTVGVGGELLEVNEGGLKTITKGLNSSVIDEKGHLEDSYLSGAMGGKK